jgi:hypothetical protein
LFYHTHRGLADHARKDRKSLSGLASSPTDHAAPQISALHRSLPPASNTSAINPLRFFPKSLPIIDRCHTLPQQPMIWLHSFLLQNPCPESIAAAHYHDNRKSRRTLKSGSSTRHHPIQTSQIPALRLLHALTANRKSLKNSISCGNLNLSKSLLLYYPAIPTQNLNAHSGCYSQSQTDNLHALSSLQVTGRTFQMSGCELCLATVRQL